MSIAHFDCFGGASGNMILGALVDAGLPLDALQRELRKLPVGEWSIEIDSVRKCGLGATYLDFRIPADEQQPGHRHGRKLDEVLHLLAGARFPAPVERTAGAIYRRLADAEALVHRVPVEEMHFHEVGEVDAILDIAGAALALHMLGVERAYCSPLPLGRGRIRCAHGEYPSPSPAALELVRGVPTFEIDLADETVTPTGAAILREIAVFEPRPAMTIDRVGYGSGRSDFPFPNVLRVSLGEPAPEAATPVASAHGDVVQLEANIDDMSPQLYEHAVELMFAAGALDVWLTPVQMKKGRPGVVLSALVDDARARLVTQTMLAETTTLGVRSWRVARATVARETATVETSLGSVRVKVSDGPAGRRARPEYDDCRQAAMRASLPLPAAMAQIEREVALWLERVHA